MFKPSDLLKEKKKKDREVFFQRGRDYYVDEQLLEKLYDVYIGKRLEAIISTYEEKKEVKNAYPHIFSFNQKRDIYKVQLKVNI